jgi:hypothetical protein
VWKPITSLIEYKKFRPMVDMRDIPLDDECKLYRIAYYHPVHPPPAPVIHNCRPSKPSWHLRSTCNRCHSLGHFTSQCPLPPPSASDIEAGQQADVAECLSQAANTKGNTRDSFGVAQINGGNFAPIPSTVQQNGKTTALNWSTSRFCLNCGSPGHHFSCCKKISFNNLLKQMEERFGPMDGLSPEMRWQFFTEIWQKGGME